MLRSKYARHTFAFGTILIASLALYLAAQAEKAFIIWFLLALILFAAILTIKEK
ncbi:MAG: hypothetical protein GY755_18155 [Chloroflexi bacterium]|nr:hypothetical protein [Chloroflexota bacterium]